MIKRKKRYFLTVFYFRLHLQNEHGSLVKILKIKKYYFFLFHIYTIEKFFIVIVICIDLQTFENRLSD